jgi:pimeloyl-ACP methyl ester carboxylesterase
MDGTGALFAPFQAAAPAGVEITVVPLPHAADDYPGLLRTLAPQIPVGPDTVLLGESFSGPRAVALGAARCPRAVVLVNSFIRAPVPAWCCRLATSALFAVPAPDAVLRTWLLGPAASPALLATFRAALRRVPPRVLAARVRTLAPLDAAADVARLRCPLLYLRGTADRLVPERSLREVVAHAPAVEVARVPGPHLLLQAAPEAAWAALIPMLARCEAS